jgi:hypothetical protein
MISTFKQQGIQLLDHLGWFDGVDAKILLPELIAVQPNQLDKKNEISISAYVAGDRWSFL